jgi:hypothetical protein
LIMRGGRELLLSCWVDAQSVNRIIVGPHHFGWENFRKTKISFTLYKARLCHIHGRIHVLG